MKKRIAKVLCAAVLGGSLAVTAFPGVAMAAEKDGGFKQTVRTIRLNGLHGRLISFDRIFYFKIFSIFSVRHQATKNVQSCQRAMK